MPGLSEHEARDNEPGFLKSPKTPLFKGPPCRRRPPFIEPQPVKLAPILISGKNCTHPGAPRSRPVPGKKSRLVRGGPSLTGRRQMDETIETVGTTTPHPPPDHNHDTLNFP